MIGTIFAIASENYQPTLNFVAKNQGSNLIPSHLEIRYGIRMEGTKESVLMLLLR